MRWEDFRMSENVDDRRGDGGSGVGFSMPGGGIGIGTIVVLGLLGWALGVDPRVLITGAEMMGAGRAPTSGYTEQQRPRQSAPPADSTGRFVSAVVAMNEDVWKDVLPQQAGVRWRAPTLVMFDGVTNSACGTAQSAMGPFYCPRDQKVYLDTSFFRDMQRKFGGGGDFAYAYVIAHEVGHHVQNLLGMTAQVDRQRGRVPAAQQNALSVRLELQADCLAGIWAHHSQKGKGWLEGGDLEEALNAAAQIGDDLLQRRSQGAVVPESFTHGSSRQRQAWLRRGLESGHIEQCNTFEARAR